MLYVSDGSVHVLLAKIAVVVSCSDSRVATRVDGKQHASVYHVDVIIVWRWINSATAI